MNKDCRGPPAILFAGQLLVVFFGPVEKRVFRIICAMLWQIGVALRDRNRDRCSHIWKSTACVFLVRSRSGSDLRRSWRSARRQHATRARALTRRVRLASPYPNHPQRLAAGSTNSRAICSSPAIVSRSVRAPPGANKAISSTPASR
jgi:hypothetical protein